MRIFRIYCSAAYDIASGLGSASYVVTEDNSVLDEDSACDKAPSANATEMLSVTNALEAVRVHGGGDGDRVFIYMNFRPVCDAFEKGWITKWQENGWKNSDGLPVRNKELWETICDHLRGMNAEFRYTKRDEMGMLEKLKKRARKALLSFEQVL